jgi:hypothetical protein
MSAVPSVATKKCEYQVTCGCRSTLTIGTEEKKLRLVIKIYNLLFDTRSSTRNEEIDDGLLRDPLNISHDR